MIKELDTKLDAFELYTVFKDDSHSFILDSSLNQDRLGRYSFISANPFKILSYEQSDLDPLTKLREELAQYQVENETELPFIGGAVGYLAYDLCHKIEDLPRSALAEIKLPDIYFGLYDWVIVVDHLKQKSYLATPNLDLVKEKELIKKVSTRIRRVEKEGVDAICYQSCNNLKTEISANFTKAEYLKAVEKIREYIIAGDIYQANLSQRLKGRVNRSSYELYRDLRRISPAPFGAFLSFADFDILSNSPERFIKVKDKLIETRPIKGTRPRGKTAKEDQRLKDELYHSEKDRAELLMIVDLERNDIGRVSKIGTVKVPELFKLEEYANVHHLVATIEGQLREDKDLIDLIKASFPGGSITGAPKIRAMEIIDELEPTERNIYTGSIGYLGFDGGLDLNIAIRTLVKKGAEIYFQVGGGITWDSNPKAEYQETLDKAESIMKAVGGYYAK